MIRVVIADDHPIVRSGLISILEKRGDIEVAGEAGNGEDLIQLCMDVKPDVAITDVSMPGPGIIQVIKKIKAVNPSTKILILSIHSPSDYAVPTLRAGAAGYIDKNESTELLPLAVRAVWRGGLYLPGKSVGSVMEVLRDNKESQKKHLSVREFEVLSLLGKGLSFKEIAERLELSPKTINTYRTRLLEKLNLESTNALISYAATTAANPDNRQESSPLAAE